MKPLIKISLFSTLVILLISVIIGQLTSASSTQAFINTRLTTLRTGVNGNVSNCSLAPGEPVKAGDIFLEVRDHHYGNSNLQAEKYHLLSSLASLRAEILHNKMSIKKLRLTHARLESLRDTGSIAAIDLEETTQDLATLRNGYKNKLVLLARSLALLKNVCAQLQISRHSTLRSPRDGVVWSVLTKNGEYVKQGDELIRIISPDDIWVEAFFNEKTAAKLKPGMAVTIEDISSSRRWTGNITFIRGGSGRISYNASIETPPSSLSQRLVAVKVKVD